MLIVLLDEPGVFVFASTTEAAQYIEPIDAESEIRAAFDEDAVPCRVDWLRPNERGRLSVKPGAYQFVPAGPADPAALVRVLEQHLEFAQPHDSAETLKGVLARWKAVSGANLA